MSFAKLNYNCFIKKRFILKRLCLKEKTSVMGLWGLSVVSANHAADQIPIPLAPPLGWSVKKTVEIVEIVVMARGIVFMSRPKKI